MALDITDILRRGPASSREMQDALGLNQPAVSRQLRLLGDAVVRFKEGRTPFYALAENAFGAGDDLPIFMADANANNTAVGRLRPLAHGGFLLQPHTGAPRVLLGSRADGLFDDLPYFLQDLRPKGFMGRQIAADLAERSPDFPPDPRRWNSSHIGRYLVGDGEDLPGNLQIGPQAIIRRRREPALCSRENYPGIARDVMNGVIPGSSAGGEQPKFAAYCEDCNAHVIVKFSPEANDSVSRRWRDVLLTEYHALETLHEDNQPAAECELLEFDGQLFLESQRFDRSGKFGRMPMISLEAVDAEFTGVGGTWPAVLLALRQQNLLSWQHLYDGLMLWVFGRLINNSDMHLGNLSLGFEGEVFRLLPAYDMCSMGFAPASGHVKPISFTPPRIEPFQPPLDNLSLEVPVALARRFWDRLAADPKLSPEFAAYLAQGNPMTEYRGADGELVDDSSAQGNLFN